MQNQFTFLFLFLGISVFGQSFSEAELARWQAQADRITIYRDNWGIPHIYGQTDADAVFGLLYTQCEDDFERVERNYLFGTGRMAEAYGEDYIYQDLRAQMYLDSVQAKALYAQSPKWMKELCNAFADGINYYLHTHPEVEPAAITRFQPWMPFTFSEGSIGGDIERVSTRGLEAFYGSGHQSYVEPVPLYEEKEPRGSNGFSIAPSKSKSGHALFLINPHTSFYFRSEVHMVSEKGLNAYGAVTWGQFFIYQGFNEDCGWMHTSTRADVMDQYLETIVEQGDKKFYKYGDELRPVGEKKISVRYKDGKQMKEKSFTTFFTHHGPVVRKEGDQWVSFRIMVRPLDALKQSYLRTKAKGYNSFRKTMKIRTNSSNNTVYADKQGNIAYWHGNFMPKRDPSYDYSGLVDGSDPKTDWQGLHKLKDMIVVRNPASGWIQNCNATPFTVSGPSSPKRGDYPIYMAPDQENFRGINAVRVLSRRNSFGLDDLIDAANDPYLSAFEKLMPALAAAYDKAGDPANSDLREAVNMLKNWDKNYGEESVPTALAIYWAEKLLPVAYDKRTDEDRSQGLMMDEIFIKRSTDREKVEALLQAMKQLEEDFGSWKTPWGEINRFQRLTGKIQQTYDDSKPSIPVGFTSSRWGSLASYGARSYPNTKRRYGRSGNSFVAVVEFGPKLIARSVVSGGQSSDPDSPHFTDQAEMFCKGEFKEVYYYKEDVLRHVEENYRPGQRK
jgi:acyl-homoserine-lactone acylase